VNNINWASIRHHLLRNLPHIVEHQDTGESLVEDSYRERLYLAERDSLYPCGVRGKIEASD